MMQVQCNRESTAMLDLLLGYCLVTGWRRSPLSSLNSLVRQRRRRSRSRSLLRSCALRE